MLHEATCVVVRTDRICVQYGWLLSQGFSAVSDPNRGGGNPRYRVALGAGSLEAGRRSIRSAGPILLEFLKISVVEVFLIIRLLP